MAKKPKVLPSIAWLAPRVRLMRVLSLMCFFGLIGLLCVYYLAFAILGTAFGLGDPDRLAIVAD